MNERNQPYRISIISAQNSARDHFIGESSPDTNRDYLGDEFKTSEPSFTGFNTDLMDFPPIVFDNETVSWDKIIKENILQPFLPKNRLILQSLVKGLQREGFKNSFDYESAIKRKSNLLAGDAGNALQIGKQLHEFKKKMEKKVKIISPKSRPNIGRGFEIRAIDRVQRLLKTKQKLQDEEQKAGEMINRRYYDLDTSLKDVRKDIDYFKLYENEKEVEPVGEPNKFVKAHRMMKVVHDFSHLRIQTPSSIASIGKSDYQNSANSTRQSLPDEPLISKKHVRRKSCCCTLCGGLSTFEKHTVDICSVKIARNIKSKDSPSKNLLQPDSLVLEKQPRSNSMRREHSAANFAKMFHKDSSHDLKPQALRSSRNLFDAERRRSAFFNLEVLNTPKLLRPKSRMAEAQKSSNDSQPDHSRQPSVPHSPHLTVITPSGQKNPQSILDLSIDTSVPVLEHHQSSTNTPAGARNSRVRLTPILSIVPQKQKPKKVKKIREKTASEKVNSLSEKQSPRPVSRVRVVRNWKKASVATVESAIVSSDVNQQDTTKEKSSAAENQDQKKSPKMFSFTSNHRRNITIGGAGGSSEVYKQLKSYLSPRELIEKKKLETVEANAPEKMVLQLRNPEEINQVYMQANKHLMASSAMYTRPRVGSPGPSISTTTTKLPLASPRTILNASPYFSPRGQVPRSNLKSSQEARLIPGTASTNNRLISTPQLRI